MADNELDGDAERDDMKQLTIALCWECTRWHKGTPACTAFPEIIPDAIFLRGFNHRKPFQGDNGILFEPIT